jgi:hypothetical protein
MSVFEEIPLEWEGKRYTVKPEQVLTAIRLLEYMEPALTLQDLMRFRSAGKMPFGTLSEAFALILRHAGADVTPEQVYEGMFTGKSSEIQARAIAATTALLTLMIPPASLAKAGKAKAAPKRAG